MPIQIDPGKQWGTQKLTTLVFATLAGVDAVQRSPNPVPLGFKWVVSFLTAKSSSGFVLQLAIDHEDNIVDTETIPGSGFNSANFPDILLDGGRTLIAIIPAGGAGLTQVKIDFWGHLIY